VVVGAQLSSNPPLLLLLLLLRRRRRLMSPEPLGVALGERAVTVCALPRLLLLLLLVAMTAAPLVAAAAVAPLLLVLLPAAQPASLNACSFWQLSLLLLSEALGCC
jgi:hypothetical protein